MKTESSRRVCNTTSSPQSNSPHLTLSVATAADREEIYRLRHEVYARELHQHAVSDRCALRDTLDEWNHYLIAHLDGEPAGFISITPPGQPVYSIDKYFSRVSLPFQVHNRLFEVRLLTVLKAHRGSEIATLLMYGALRWVESHGGTHIVAIGRREVVDFYRRAGLETMGLSTTSGAVTYDLMHAPVSRLRQFVENFPGLLDRIEEHVCWKPHFPFRPSSPCFHGGAFFKAIGEDFASLHRRHDIINADVLDAWFPPAPGVATSIREDLPWLLRTSPPTACDGLIEAIASARGVKPGNILPGAGSSDLIFRAFRHWLTAHSRVLLLEPTYGEYAHVLEKVIGCTVDRLQLERSENYEVNLEKLHAALDDHYDLVVLVNPNSPTGRHINRTQLEAVLQSVPPATRVWVDETYVEYAGASESIERFAARSEQVIVCKSMSKVYALSGARVAYLCAGPHQLESLRAITPPWVVGLPSQLAAVRALQDPAYYQARYHETKVLRCELAAAVLHLGWEIVPGIGPFVLAHLPEEGPTAVEIVLACRARGLYLRDAGTMGGVLGDRAVRIAVKDAVSQAKMIGILREEWRRFTVGITEENQTTVLPLHIPDEPPLRRCG
ncbi:MAG TPA: aminotransferase class I/II-fold pyridoxal phosphate-dependent enzyme [Roseimicrobium sp.]|nr:aminotransferase class I/II-fold pyridoxal phosphate-dependent enzyme [Roseimicrobium sp.]